MNKTFSQLIVAARKAALISQKHLAAAIRKLGDEGCRGASDSGWPDTRT